MNYFSVANWDRFQHYKERNPPWIKLHNSLLNDYEFSCLQDASKLHLLMIWMIASMLDNKIPCDPAWIKNHLHLESEPDLKPLIDGGFLVLDSDMQATCKQSACLETETETETETDKDSCATNVARLHFSDFWAMYPRKTNKQKAKLKWDRMTLKNQRLAFHDIPTRFRNVEKQFIMHPTTYLNGKRWEDERIEPPRTGAQILMDNIGHDYERTNNRQPVIGNQRNLGQQVLSASAGQAAYHSAPMDEDSSPFHS